MKWKKGLPKQIGWYWVRDYPEEGSRIVYVRLYVGRLAVGNSTLKGWKGFEQAHWAGPIPEPED